MTVAPVPAITLSSVATRSGENEEAQEVFRELRFLFLGCEDKPPYGPYDHTAKLFLDLLILALKSMEFLDCRVVLDVYHASRGHLPPRKVYSSYDGVILPGSFSAAYHLEPWILELSQIIQEELVAKNIPTLGVCFGHQLYAHSFPEGSAIKCPAGPQGGRKVSKMSLDGEKWFSNTLELFYTHGDMVEKLPAQGRTLGGTDEVPFQAAIYFSKDDDKNQKPIAVTFQAHPEYASSRPLGLDRTLNQILDAMNQRQDISDEELRRAKDDAKNMFETVQLNSIATMVKVGRLLGWFPVDPYSESQLC